MQDCSLITLLNMNLGWLPRPKVLPPFIKDKNNWILVRQRTNMGPPNRALVFNHAGEVEVFTLTLTDHLL